MVEEALWSQEFYKFVKCFWENSKVWIVWKGCNKAGWYLEMAVYVVGGRRGFILLPDGRGGRGG